MAEFIQKAQHNREEAERQQKEKQRDDAERSNREDTSSQASRMLRFREEVEGYSSTIKELIDDLGVAEGWFEDGNKYTVYPEDVPGAYNLVYGYPENEKPDPDELNKWGVSFFLTAHFRPLYPDRVSYFIWPHLPLDLKNRFTFEQKLHEITGKIVGDFPESPDYPVSTPASPGDWR